MQTTAVAKHMDMQLWETLETAQSACSSHSSSVMDAMPTVQDSSPAAECTVLVFDPIPVAKKRKKLGKLWCGLAKLQRRKKHSHLIREAVTDACADFETGISIKDFTEAIKIMSDDNKDLQTRRKKQYRFNKRAHRRELARMAANDIRLWGAMSAAFTATGEGAAASAAEIDDVLQFAKRRREREAKRSNWPAPGEIWRKVDAALQNTPSMLAVEEVERVAAEWAAAAGAYHASAADVLDPS